MIKTLFAAALLSFSVGAKSIEHREAATTNQVTYVNGCFNLRNAFEFDNDDFDLSDYEIVFEDITYDKSYLNPISFYDASLSFYYLYKINFNTNYSSTLATTFYYYDTDTSSSFVLSIGNADNITDLDHDYSDLIINFRTTYILSDDIAKLFNICFTQEDNVYVKSYNGYYSFTSDPHYINSDFYITGSIAFNNYIYSVFGNKDDGTFGPHNYMVYGSYYNITSESYQLMYYDLPFARSNVTSLNVLMSNVKLTVTSYQTLNNIGIFAYQHDPTYDDSDWKDLLFSVMDSPLYMISRLLNFELFGINLYIALAGLLTIVVIVFCVRKFM